MKQIEIGACACALLLAAATGGCGGSAGAPEPKAGAPGAPEPSAPVRLAVDLPPGHGGPATNAYADLFKSGCDPEAARVSTPLEARILRHTPHAIAGQLFEDDDIAEFFRQEHWYDGARRANVDPPYPRVEIAPRDAECVARLDEHERALRSEIGEFPRELEVILTADPGIYYSLRELALIAYDRGRRPTSLRHESVTGDGSSWVWKLRVADEPADEIVTIACVPDEDSWDCDFTVGKAP